MPELSEQLFPPDRLFLPCFRKDETLYSWCAHYHILSSNPTARQTCAQLFGHRDAGLKHDFPIHLDKLIDRTLGQLGTRDQIILDRTPVGSFARFVESARLQTVCNLMGTGPEHRVARTLGILAGHQVSPAPLKACSVCMSESIAGTHSSIWRLDHQLPGVYICKDHDCRLLVATPEAHRRARSELLLPHMLPQHEWLNTPDLSPTATCRLRKIADWSRALHVTHGLSFIPFDADILRDACHIRAKHRGWVAIDGSLHFKRIRGEIGAAYSELFSLPGLEFLAGSQRDHGGYVGFLMHQYRGVHHPLMFIALLSFLFDSPEDFLDCYGITSETSPEHRRTPLRLERNALSEWLAEMVETQGMSVNQAALSAGIPTSRALIYLKEKGVEYKKRPRVVGSPLETRLVERLELGDAPASIAAEMNIRRAFIKDYLASHAELRQRHSEARSLRRLEEYRAKFIATLKANPSLPIKRIRRETDSGFEWLYRNDRAWLADVLPGIWHR